MKKCFDCSAEAAEGRSRCPKCLKRVAAYMRQRNKKRKAAGICIDCANPASDGIYCSECNKNRAVLSHKRYTERKSSGLCTMCGTPISGQYMCAACLAKSQASRHNGARSRLYQSIKERDGWKCRLCGKARNLVIHHIDGQGERTRRQEQEGRPRQVPNNEPSNLISLCRSCHGALTRFSHSIDRPLVIRLINSVKSEVP